MSGHVLARTAVKGAEESGSAMGQSERLRARLRATRLFRTLSPKEGMAGSPGCFETVSRSLS